MLKKAILKEIVEGSMGKRFPIYSETKNLGFLEGKKTSNEIEIERMRISTCDNAMKRTAIERLKVGSSSLR